MFYLKTVSATISNIQRGRDKIGTVSASREKPGMFVALVDGEKVYADTRTGAFEAMVARLNRISLCGADDAEKARAVIAERNAEVRREADQINSLIGFRAVKVRSRGIRI